MCASATACKVLLCKGPVQGALQVGNPMYSMQAMHACNIFMCIALTVVLEYGRPAVNKCISQFFLC